MRTFKCSVRHLCVYLFLLPVIVFAQQHETGNWLMYFGTNRISENWSIHTEIQYRNHTIVPNNNIEQLLLRTGLNYHFSKKASVTAGYAYIPSYFYESETSGPNVREHRIWEQFILTNKVGRVKFEHRYRIEQRFIEDYYRNRFRYRLMLFFPLNNPELTKNTWFIGLYDEIFIKTDNNYFDRNRLYGALGYIFNRDINVQAGILHQQLKDFGKWHLQFALIFNTDLRKKK